MQASAGLFYNSASGCIHDLYYDPGLARMLSRWDTYRSIDSALLAHLGLEDFSEAADRVSILGRRSDESRVTRSVTGVLTWLHRRQLSILNQRPFYVRLRSLLETLVSASSLESEAEVLAAARAVAHPCRPIPLRQVGLVTRDAPARLRNCAESYLSAGSSLDLVVIDGSAQAHCRRSNRQVLKELAARSGRPVAYADLTDVRAYAARLVAMGCEPATIGLALDAAAPGDAWARNALLLHVGRKPLLIARTQAVEQRQCGSRPTSLLVTEAPIVTDDQTIGETSSRDDRRVDAKNWALHDRVLGRSPAELIADFSARHENIRLDRICGSFLSALTSAAARIAVTTIGQSGATRSPNTYVLSHVAPPLGDTFAVDHCESMPPFVPADALGTLFTRLVSAIHVEACYASVPISSGAGTQYDCDTGAASTRPILSACLALAGLSLEGRDSARRLRRVGRVMSDAAALSPGDLRTHVREGLTYLAGRGALPCWFSPEETGAAYEHAPTEQAAHTLAAVGQLLYGWPDVVDAATRLRSSEPLAWPV